MYKDDSDTDVVSCLNDVLKGYSKFDDFFIKHLDVFEENQVRAFYEEQMEKLVEIPTKEEQEKTLIECGVWTQKQESKLNVTKIRLEAAQATLPNILIESQRSQIENQIADLTSEYLEMFFEKNEYLGSIREDIANDNTTEFVIKKLVFKDPDFLQPAFATYDDLFDIPSQQLQKLKSAISYIKHMPSTMMCKKMACCGSFQSMIGIMPKENEYKILRNHITDATVNQISLIQYGQIFRFIMENYKVSEEDAKDPEKILEIPKQAKKIEEMKERAESSGGNSSYVGATKEEMSKMGMSGTDIFQLLKDSGKKSLGKEDLI